MIKSVEEKLGKADEEQIEGSSEDSHIPPKTIDKSDTQLIKLTRKLSLPSKKISKIDKIQQFTNTGLEKLNSGPRANRTTN